MSENNGNSNGVLLGILVGGIIAGASVAFFNSKAGKTFCHNAICKCQDLGDEIEDRVESIFDKNKSLASDVCDKVCFWTDSAKKLFELVSSGIGASATKENKNLAIKVLIGAAVGGALAVGAGLLRSKNKYHHYSLMDTVTGHASSLRKIVQGILDATEKNIKSSHFDSKTSSAVNDFADFATAGMQLWQKMKRK